MRNECINCKALGLPDESVLLDLDLPEDYTGISLTLIEDYINNPHTKEDPVYWSLATLERASKVAINSDLEKARRQAYFCLCAPQKHTFSLKFAGQS